MACQTCGHEWRVQPGNVAAGQSCPMCAHNAPVDKAEWDRRASKVGLRWTSAVIASSLRTPAECLTCGHRFTPFARNVGSGQGCPACATYGFNPAEPAVVYLLRADDGALKVGIANQTSTRLEQHRRAGWQTLRVWTCERGDHARDIERGVIAWWRDELGLPPARTIGDGWTETVHEDLLDASAVQQHVDQVHSRTVTVTRPA
ncbi:GIY-YIG nuclease family protein [Candidatus Solirubrobacter pratensis]|uniref:hypothetical protein n=1 Tax=Candidatus Solirubrobacter pratensis TaxID=1298857 RepID=UPI0004894339|nr:hypothetical protein [Candidatus Solirubrobacter pratensis]